MAVGGSGLRHPPPPPPPPAWGPNHQQAALYNNGGGGGGGGMVNFGHNGGFAGMPPSAAGPPMHMHPGNGMNGDGSNSGMMPPPPPMPPQAALLSSSHSNGGVMTAPGTGGFGPAISDGSTMMMPGGEASVADAQAMLEASSPQVCCVVFWFCVLCFFVAGCACSLCRFCRRC